MLSETHEGEISGLYGRLLGYTNEKPKVLRKEKLKESSRGPSGSTPGLHISRAAMLTHFHFLLDCAVSPVGHGGHAIYKTAHVSVIKVVLYLSPLSVHAVNVVLNHNSACFE